MGCLRHKEADLVDISRMSAFFESDMGRRVLSSPEVRREWSFDYVLDETGATHLQGIIDCAFREAGGWVVLDYKTDRFEDDSAFVERHQRQLNWYRIALADLTGEPVTGMWLWSIRKERAYPVPVIEVR